MTPSLLLLLIVVPIVGAGLILLGSPARLTALVTAVFILIAALLVAFFFPRGSSDFHFVSSIRILPEWKLNLTLGVDGLSLIMLLLAAIVTFAAIWFTGPIAKYEGGFYACLLFISAGAIGAFASLNLFFFYAFHELALIPTFLLIGIWGSGNRTAAAWKITIYLALGSFILLLGLILLYESIPVGLRSFDLRDLKAAAASIPLQAQPNIYLLLLLGFGILVSLFPFHTWAPEAYASAPAPAAMLHAGVLKKFGLYGLLRLAVPLVPAGVQHWLSLLLVLLLGNIIYIGFVTIAQKRLDWVLGYSSVMHMGYIFLGFASTNLLGMTGAAILMFAHGLSIALLFAITGEVRARTGTLVLEELGGLGKAMPLAALAFGIGAFAAIGLPGLANFAAEIMIFFGAFQKGWEMERFHFFQVATLLGLWGVVMSAVYMLRAYRSAFMGAMPGPLKNVADLKPTLRVPIIALAGAMLWIGFFPQSFVHVVAPALQTSVSTAASR